MIALMGGGKGGVGKTIVAMLALHHYISAGVRPVLIETDDSNQEVYKSYNGKLCDAYAYDIDQENGWESTLTVIGNTLDKDPNIPIIINTGARNRKTIMQYGDVLNNFPDLITLWVIDEQPDGLVALKEYLQTIQQKICIVKNGGVHKKQESDFDFFANSQMCANGMPSVYLPAATAATVNGLYKRRKAIHELKDCLSFGEKMLAESWLKKADLAYSQAIEKAIIYNA